MTIVVEDGTGLANADAYISIEFFETYAEDHGFDLSDYSEEQIEQAIRRATTWFDSDIGLRFNGFLVSTTQSLLLPQSGLIDRNGYGIPFNVIHARVKAAVAEGTWRELQTPYSLMPDVTGSSIKKRAKVGPIEVEYAGMITAESQAAYMTIINGIIAPLFPRTSVTGGLYGRAVRS